MNRNVEESLNRDYEAMKANRRKLEKNFTVDDYIAFITQMNEMDGHKGRKFKPIQGTRFLL